MKFVVISDLHANLAALQQVLAEIEREGNPLLIIAGDIVNMGPRPREVIELLRSYPGQSLSISGNHEGYVLAQRTHPSLEPPYRWLFAPSRWTMKQLCRKELDHLATLPTDLQLKDPAGGTVAVFHGSPRSQIDCIFPDTSEHELKRMMHPYLAGNSLVICGHTHVPSIHKLKEGTVVNVGSVGMSYGGDTRACFATFEWDYRDERWLIEHRRVHYDQSSLIEELHELAKPSGGGPVTRLIARAMTTGNPYFLDGFLRRYTSGGSFPSPPEDYEHLAEAIDDFLSEWDDKKQSAG